MTREIQRSFRELLNKTNWIDIDTKRLATEKVNAMSLRIGYPDVILQPHLLNERYKDVIYFYIKFINICIYNIQSKKKKNQYSNIFDAGCNTTR